MVPERVNWNATVKSAAALLTALGLLGGGVL